MLGSFLSSVGDFTLIFSLSNGVIKEIKIVSFAPFFWLIPAIIMYFSLLTKKYFLNRESNIRRDYSYLLLFIGLVEVLCALLLYYFQSQSFIILACSFFIIVYAFFKEGIPRLSFNNKVYTLFCHKEHYLKLAAQKGSIDLIGGTLGIIISSYLVGANLWRMALIIDAITFFIFGVIIFFGGTKKLINQNISSNFSSTNEQIVIIKNLKKCLVYIMLAIPLVHYINALYQNYIPIINNELGLLSFSTTILLISIVRAHIIVLGYFLDRICNKFYWDKILLWFPISYMFISLFFLLFPCNATMLLTVILSSFFVGIFLPLSLNIINHLTYSMMLEYNTKLVKRIAIFQTMGCVISIVVFNFYGFRKEIVASNLLFFSTFYILFCLFYEKRFLASFKDISNYFKKNV